MAIRIMVYNPQTEETQLACLQRPLQWDAVVLELKETMGIQAELTQEFTNKSEIILYPTKNVQEMSVKVGR